MSQLILFVPAFFLVFFLGCSGTGQQDNFPDTAIVALSNPNHVLGDTLKGMVIPVNSELWKEELEVKGLDTGYVTEWKNGVLHFSRVAEKIGAYNIHGSMKFNAGNAKTELPFKANGVTLPEPIVVGITKYMIKDIENSLLISAAGIPFFELAPVCTNATLISEGEGAYKIIPHSTGTLKINILWEHEGMRKNLNALEFEVVEKK